MVLPEGTPPPGRDAPRPSRLAALGGAVVAVTAALAALTLLTTPGGEVSAPTSTTTTTVPIEAPTTTIDVANFTIADIARGNPFRWTKAPEIGAMWPVALLEHHGRIYLFGSPGNPYTSDDGGLLAWVSDEGIHWEPAGGIGPGTHRVYHVSSIGDELVALGQRIADGAPHVFTSSDGLHWDDADLPVPEEAQPGTVFDLRHAISREGRPIVYGSGHHDAIIAAADRLPEEVVDAARRYGWHITDTADGRSLQVNGPLGIFLYSATLDDLGIDPAGSGPSQRQETYVWVSTEDGSWEVDVVEDFLLERIWISSDDRLLGFAYGPGGGSVLSSIDGVEWSSAEEFGVDAWVVATWDGRLVGDTGNRTLVVSADGEEWDDLGVGDLLPFQIPWYLYPVAAGEGGLAVVANQDRPRPGPGGRTVTIEEDGHVVSLGVSEGNMVVDRPDGSSVSIPLWTPVEPPPIVDLESGEVTFLEPGSGEPLVTLDLATLEKAEISLYTDDVAIDRALLHTAHGEEWSVQSLEKVVGASSQISQMLVAADRVVMVTTPAALDFRSHEPPKVAISVGEFR